MLQYRKKTQQWDLRLDWGDKIRLKRVHREHRPWLNSFGVTMNINARCTANRMHRKNYNHIWRKNHCIVIPHCTSVSSLFLILWEGWAGENWTSRPLPSISWIEQLRVELDWLYWYFWAHKIFISLKFKLVFIKICVNAKRHSHTGVCMFFNKALWNSWRLSL